MLGALGLGYIIAFFLNVTYIALKAFQQLNVVHNKYLWVFPVSLCMALCEVITTKLIVANGVWVFIPIGVGGGLGCVSAMWLHKKIRNSVNKNNKTPKLTLKRQADIEKISREALKKVHRPGNIQHHPV